MVIIAFIIALVERIIVLPYTLLHWICWLFSIMVSVIKQYIKARQNGDEMQPIAQDDMNASFLDSISQAPYIVQLIPTAIILYFILK